MNKWMMCGVVVVGMAMGQEAKKVDSPKPEDPKVTIARLEKEAKEKDSKIEWLTQMANAINNSYRACKTELENSLAMERLRGNNPFEVKK